MTSTVSFTTSPPLADPPPPIDRPGATIPIPISLPARDSRKKSNAFIIWKSQPEHKNKCISRRGNTGTIATGCYSQLKRFRRLAARHRLACGTPTTGHSTATELSKYSRLGRRRRARGGGGRARASASEVEAHDRHDMRRRKRAQEPTSKPPNCSGDPSGPNSELTTQWQENTTEKIEPTVAGLRREEFGRNG